MICNKAETNKSEQQFLTLPKNDKKPSSSVLNTMFMKSRFLQYILCENLDLEVASVERWVQPPLAMNHDETLD